MSNFMHVKKKKKKEKNSFGKTTKCLSLGEKAKGSQTAASFKVLVVEHPRKKQITLSHKPLEKII